MESAHRRLEVPVGVALVRPQRLVQNLHPANAARRELEVDGIVRISRQGSFDGLAALSRKSVEQRIHRPALDGRKPAVVVSRDAELRSHDGIDFAVLFDHDSSFDPSTSSSASRRWYPIV